MLTNRDIVCVSIMDWDWPFWTSRQHLMSEFARNNRVLFVDPPMTFASDYLDARRDPRLGSKFRRWLEHKEPRRVADNLLVWSPPPAVPFNRITQRQIFDGLLAFNQRVFRRSLRRTMDSLDMHDPILFVSFNVYYGDAVVGKLGEALSIYHCTDEIAGFPGYSRFIPGIEARLAARSDLVIATSEVLRDAKLPYNPRTYFVPNAADVGMFSKALDWQAPIPPDLEQLPQPRAGFVGQVEYRFDAQLVRYAAEHLPNWSFALIGPVQRGCEAEATLHDVPNVHFLGLKPREALPGYLAGLDATLIPYKVDRLGAGLYPLKVHEYLAAGKPVVATPLPSMQGLADRLYLASDGPAFVTALEQARAEDSPARRARLSRLTQGETWAARAATISALIDQVGRTPRACQPRLPFSAFVRLGREFAKRPSAWPKRLAYAVLGDMNLHRRLRTAYALTSVPGGRGRPIQVLDAGCGEGALSFAVSSRFPAARVCGVDSDAGSVATCNAAARRLGAQNLRFQNADITALPHHVEFDVVTCVDVLEHVEDDRAALDNFHQVLKPDGLLVVHVPMRHQLQQRCLPTHRHHEVDDHVRDEYLQGELVEKVERAGFVIEKFGTTFGAPGELAFELNTLFADSRVGGLLAVLTFPLTLLLGYLDLARADTGHGNSFLVVARKPT